MVGGFETPDPLGGTNDGAADSRTANGQTGSGQHASDRRWTKPRRSRRFGIRVVAATILCLVALIGTACASSRPSSPPTATGPGVDCTSSNVRVSHDDAVAHSEPMVVENPNNPLNLVGGSKFFTDAAHYRFKIGYYTSFDGGCSWTDGGVLPGFEAQDVTSDITFAFGTHNDVYAAVLTIDPKGNWGIAVSASLDAGRTFAAPVTVFHDTTGAVASDKPWIAVDRSNGPNRDDIYVVWSHDYNGTCGDDNGCTQALGFSRSTDGGRTFSPVAQVEGNAPFCTDPATGRPAGSTRCDGVLGATPIVLPDGTLAVAFAYIDVMSDNKEPTRMVVTSSRDGGLSWSTPVLVANISDIWGWFPPERYRNASLPAFACDPRTGQLYLAWSDKATGDADILLATSKDEGQTWSAPIRVNDDPPRDGANQFQPQLTVAPDGVVNVSFFDSRLDPEHKLLDLFLAQSTDHGATFRPNVRVTSGSFDPAVDAPVDSAGNQFIGDYQGLADDDRFAHPFWNDSRTGKQEIFTAAVPSAH
jgi:hypothetical protein